MLDQLRSSAGSWVAKIFIGLLALSFGVWGINDVFRGSTSQTLVQVGDRHIGAEEFRQAFDQQVRAFSRRTGQAFTAEQARQIGLDQQVLSSLVQGAALETQAKAMQLVVPDKVIADEVAANKVFHNTRGQFDPDYFRRILANANMTEQQFMAEERQNKLRATLSGAVDEGLKAPAPMVEAVWKYRNEQRDARYFLVTADISKITDPGDQDLKSFYEANGGLFSIPERRAISVVVADADAVGARLPVDDDQVQAEYDRNKDTYGTPEKRTIQQIAFPNMDEARKAFERIKGGADFLAVAKERGLTEADATLGEFTKSQVPDPALADAAFQLQENAVSEPVAGKLATVLLRVTGIAPGATKTLEEAKPEIVKKIQHERGRDEVLNLYDKIEDARAGGQSLEEIAKAENLKLLALDGLDRSGRDGDGKEVEDFPSKDKVLEAAFSTEVGADNEPVSTQSDGFVWYEVTGITPRSVKPLDQVREDAIAAWKKRKQGEASLARAEELRKQAEGGTPLDRLASETGAEVKSVTGIKRNEADAGFGAGAISALFAAPADGFAVSPDPDGVSAMVIQSTPVLGEPYDPNSEDAKAIAKALDESLGNDLYAQYINGLQKSIGVKINEAEWSKLSAGRS